MRTRRKRKTKKAKIASEKRVARRRAVEETRRLEHARQVADLRADHARIEVALDRMARHAANLRVADRLVGQWRSWLRPQAPQVKKGWFSRAFGVIF